MGKINMQEARPIARRKRVRLFKAIALLSPLLLLLALELVLRLCGYGHNLSLFVKDPEAPGYMIMNKYASEKFFSNTVDATVGNEERFAAKKLPGTVRIFVLGESTTIGYPYMHNGSFHRLLKYRLMHTFPDKSLEVINLSLTAVNSYTVLDFTRQLVDWRPDAVLIYCGHNEYYGAMGVGSTSNIGNNALLIHTMMALRSWRVVQLMTHVVHGIKGFFASQPDPRETLMKRMADRQEIAYGSALYEKGIRQFENNMNAVCQILSGKNIPVYISTLVSNEKDLRPFISAKGEHSAAAQFLQAQAAYVEEDYPMAKRAFVNARDLDLLRFRAPDTLNGLIRGLASHFPNVHLVDARQLFEQHSPHGILGNETLLEHVHPNLYGYALLSEAYYQAMKQTQFITTDWPVQPLFDEFVHIMPVTRVDSLKGAYEIAQLRSKWPFNESPIDTRPHTFEERLASDLLAGKIAWNQAMDTLLPYYLGQNNYQNALKVAEATLLEYPEEPVFYKTAAQLSIQLGNTSQAALYMQKAYELSPRTRTQP